MRLLSFATITAVAGVFACGSSTGPGEPTPDHIKVTPAYVSLGSGGTQQLAVVVYDASNTVMPNAPLTYRSADTTVAKVSSSGLVTAVGTGLTTITVSSPPASASIVVTVSGVATVQLSPDSSFLIGPQTVQLTAVARDSLGNVVPTAPIGFLSRDTSVVTVSSAGLVTTHGAGSVYVIAFSGPAKDSVVVTALLARVNIGSSAVPFAVGRFSATRAYVTLEGDSAVQLLDLATPGTVGSTIAVGQLPTSLAINNAGTRAYVGNQGSSSVTVINTGDGTVAGSIPINGTVLDVLVSPGDSLLFVGTDAGQLYVVRLATSTVTDSLPVSVTNTMVMRGDTSLFANEVFLGTVKEINLRTRQVVQTLPVGGRPQAMLLSSGGTTLYLANEIGQLQFWDLTTGSLSSYIGLPGGGGYGMARSPANGLLYVSTSYIGSRVLVIDPTAHQVVRTIGTGGTPRRIAFTPDGSVGIVANEAGWVDYIK